MTIVEMIRECHARFGEHDHAPGLISPTRTKLRMDLLTEEVNELREATAQRDIVAIADALGDVVYVTYGTAFAYGVALATFPINFEEFDGWCQCPGVTPILGTEMDELQDAIHRGDIVKITEALTNIAYVAYGTAFIYNIPLDKVLAEIHRANMSKDFTGAEGEDKKLTKGSNYRAPELAPILDRHEISTTRRG